MIANEVNQKLKEISVLSSLEQEQKINEISKETEFTKTSLRDALKIIIKEKKHAINSAKFIEAEINDSAKAMERQIIIDTLFSNYLTCGIGTFVRALELDLYRKAIDAYAKRIAETNDIVTFKDNKTIFIYSKSDGIYEEGGDILISQKIQSDLHEYAEDKTVKEIINKIRRKTFVDRESLNNQPKKYQPVGNGLLNLETGDIEPFTPKYIYFTKIRIDFMEDKECPTFINFLNTSLEEGISIDIVQEWMGNLLLNDNRFQRALLLYGAKGENGKSVLLKVIGNFLGHKNCCSISLQALEKNAFALARLANKRANIFYDLPKSALSQTSNFKMIVSGDPVTGEHKGQDSFEFIPNTKMMFSCNEVPRTPDRTTAFFRRWIILQFNKTFPEGSKQRIENLDELLSTKEELEGILQFAYKGLQKLIKQKKFTENMSPIELREFWLKKSDSVASFAMDTIEVSKSGEYMTKNNIYERYQNYCEEQGYEPLSINVFFKGLKDILNLEEDFRPTIIKATGESIRIYAMKVKLKYPDEENERTKILKILKDSPNKMFTTEELGSEHELVKLVTEGLISEDKKGYWSYI